MSLPQTIAEIAADLAAGRTTATRLAEASIERIRDASGEGPRAFVDLDEARVRAQAAAQDQLLARGIRLSPLAGIPISVKDLFDVQGEVTRAGSRILAGAAPAARDAVVVARLRSAGAVIVGRTNMTEFAFSGIGYNPHYGTPASPWDRKTGRIPGGSSSGAAVSVADGMVAVGLGTDTGGSTRIPAAFCDIVGWKPTARRVPLDGCLPLAGSLDSIGPLAPSVACCAVVDAVLAGEAPVAPEPRPVEGLRLLAPTNYVHEGLDEPVAAAFARALASLAEAGARVVERALPVLDRVPELFAKGGIAAGEAYAFHHRWIAERGESYDGRVRQRIELGREQGVADYLDLLALRRALAGEFDAATDGFDAVLMPTTAIVPVPIAAITPQEPYANYLKVNGQTLRHTTIANQMDRCAVSLPCGRLGEAPVGLMLVGERGGDRALLAVARGIEAALRPRRQA